MKKTLFIVLIAFCARPVLAQFSDSLRYYAGFTSTGTYNRTNASYYYLFNNALKLSAQKKSMSYNFFNKWLYGQKDDQLTNNDLFSNFDINLHKTFPHFYYWGLFSYPSAFSLKINNQLQSGGGIAYNIIEQKRTILNLSYGLLYDYSDILRDTLRKRYELVRHSFRIKIKWGIGTRLSFSGNAFYQPGVRDYTDYIIRSEATLSLKVKKWLSLTASMNYNEMSRTRAQNLFMTYGLVIENYY